jgi:archaellum component FlaC
MAVMMARESWTDARLDDLRAEMRREFIAVRAEVQAGFDRVDKKLDKIDERFAQIDERFGKIDERFESQTRMLLYGILGTCASIVAGFGAVVGLVAATI